ncbi:MAG: nucleotidyltransferase domain-containing protein [Desulfobacterales bacterium]
MERYSIVKIGVFGSCAPNTITAESDVDVVVVLGNQDLFNLIGIKQDLGDQLQIPVDIVSYREKMNQHLKRRIDGEALYV